MKGYALSLKRQRANDWYNQTSAKSKRTKEDVGAPN